MRISHTMIAGVIAASMLAGVTLVGALLARTIPRPDWSTPGPSSKHGE